MALLKSGEEGSTVYDIFRRGDTALRDSISLNKYYWGNFSFSNGFLVLSSSVYNNASRGYFRMNKNLSGYLGNNNDLVIDIFYLYLNNAGTISNNMTKFEVSNLSSATGDIWSTSNKNFISLNMYVKNKIPLDYIIDSSHPYLSMLITPANDNSNVTCYIKNMYIEKGID